MLGVKGVSVVCIKGVCVKGMSIVCAKGVNVVRIKCVLRV